MILGITAVGPPISKGKAPYGKHLHWRLHIVNNYGGPYTSLFGLQMRNNIGGGQIPGATVTSSYSSPGALLDEDFDTNWTGHSTGNFWFKFSYLTPTAVVEVALAHSLHDDRTPNECILQFSDDDVTWTDAFTFYLTGSLYNKYSTFPETLPENMSRTWRLNVTANYSNPYTYIKQIEFRGEIGGVDLTHPVPSNGKGDETGRAFGTSAAWNMFDDIGDSQQGGNYATPKVGFVFPYPVKIEELSLKISTFSRRPRNFNLEYLRDGYDDWVVYKSWADVIWSVGDETQTFS